MATKYLKVCDRCGVEKVVEANPFGANMLPDGWIKAAEWGKDGSPDEVLACSWLCLSRTAKDKANA